MKILFCAICAGTLLLTSCGGVQEAAHKPSSPAPSGEAAINRETAVRIAKEDARQAYTLKDYNIGIYEQPKTWRVVFKLRDPGLDGGGPDYLIDKKTGKILNATYNK